MKIGGSIFWAQDDLTSFLNQQLQTREPLPWEVLHYTISLADVFGYQTD